MSFNVTPWNLERRFLIFSFEVGAWHPDTPTSKSEPTGRVTIAKPSSGKDIVNPYHLG